MVSGYNQTELDSQIWIGIILKRCFESRAIVRTYLLKKESFNSMGRLKFYFLNWSKGHHKLQRFLAIIHDILLLFQLVCLGRGAQC